MQHVNKLMCATADSPTATTRRTAVEEDGVRVVR